MLNRRNLSILAGLFIIIGIAGSLLMGRITSTVEPISEEKVIDDKQVSVIDIDSDNAYVNIFPSSENSIKVTLEGEIPNNIEQTFDTKVKGSTLYVTYNEFHGLRSWFNFNITHIFNPVTIDVYLPEKQYESIIVSSHNGKVMAEKINADEVELITHNGRVTMNEIHSSEISAETSNGSVNVKNSNAQNIYVDSANGTISIDHVDGDIVAGTHNGEIEIAIESLERNMKLSSHNGDIFVTTKNEPTNVQFSVSVHNGDVSILDKYDRNAILGNGDHLIELSTHNGSIIIDK